MWLLAGVGPLVPGCVRLLSEPLGTERAMKGGVVSCGVDLFVLRQLANFGTASGSAHTRAPPGQCPHTCTAATFVAGVEAATLDGPSNALLETMPSCPKSGPSSN